MDEPSETQRGVGQKYRKNLGYFKHAPFIAREKFYLTVLLLVLGVYGIFWLEGTHSDIVYNPAPLSISHANLESNCAACHNTAARNILASLQPGDLTGQDKGSAHPMFFSSSLAINQACEKCHSNMDLHQPTSQTLALQAFHSELHVVTATGCFACHQEHLGRVAISIPGDSSCAACHNDSRQMSTDIIHVALKGARYPVAYHGMTSDGVIHFIPPERQTPLPLFASFENGHPAFEYEQPGLKDPDALTFSHRQHLVPSMKLSCADCHKPAVDGVYYGRVTYAAACQRCHALQIDPANPDLLLPHGDVGRVRTFLHSLVYQYSELYRQRQAASGVAVSPADAKTFATTQVLSLVQKTNVRSPDELDHRILFTSDPYKDSPPTNERPFFSGCAYCHQVTQPAGGGDPVITPPRMAERWLAHGAFTHAKHVSMSCVSCHDANNSRQATDVIMPPKESCVSCHRTNGVAPSNCLACHGFHSPQSVTKTVKAQWNLSQLALAQGVAPLNNFLTPDQSVKQKDKP